MFGKIKSYKQFHEFRAKIAKFMVPIKNRVNEKQVNLEF